MFKAVIVQKGKLLNPGVKRKSEREASLALALVVARKILALGTF